MGPEKRTSRPQGRAAGATECDRPAETGIERFPPWKLQDAKAKFSEVVRRARADGPQRITFRGKDTVVVIAVEDIQRLLPPESSRPSLVEFLKRTALGELDVSREPDRGRDLAL